MRGKEKVRDGEGKMRAEGELMEREEGRKR